MASPFSEAADFYVSLGWRVFPLKEGSKLPAIKGGHGFKDATDDPQQIDKWVKEFPRANIAVATGSMSGIVVVDVDPRNGGRDSLAKLAGGGKVFSLCPQARTGNGGWHFYYALPHGLKASKDKLGPGIDIKAEGGYVVAAPSRIAKSQQGPGGEYTWLRRPESPALPPFPAWALDWLRPRVFAPKFQSIASSGEAAKSLEGMASKLAMAMEGTRNDLLNWAAYTAGSLVRQGKLAAGTVDARLTQAALAAGLTLAETKATIASGLKGSE